MLEGKHALVFGASAGIGRATAKALAQAGAEITILARREKLLQDLLSELQELGASKVRYIVADMDDRDSLYSKIQNLLLSTNSVQIWINNTGGPPPSPLLSATEEDILSALGRHLLSSQRILPLLIPGMQEANYGRIINILSISVRTPIISLGVSNLTRAAMASWAKTLSKELPPNITINSILPGYTATERLSALAQSLAQSKHCSTDDIEENWTSSIPEGRLGQPEELAAAITFLASPAASYIRGICLPVDGGQLPSI